jgi:hypothetical protein
MDPKVDSYSPVRDEYNFHFRWDGYRMSRPERQGRTWLIALPFVGVLIDIASMWLKGLCIAIFWLHVPGGGLWVVFVFVFIKRSTKCGPNWHKNTGSNEITV